MGRGSELLPKSRSWKQVAKRHSSLGHPSRRQGVPLSTHPGDTGTVGDYGWLRVWSASTSPEPHVSVPGQELKELTAQVKDVSVTVGMDSRCHIDLSGIVEEVKLQYDAIAARSLEEAEAYSRRQVRFGAD